VRDGILIVGQVAKREPLGHGYGSDVASGWSTNRPSRPAVTPVSGFALGSGQVLLVSRRQELGEGAHDECACCPCHRCRAKRRQMFRQTQSVQCKHNQLKIEKKMTRQPKLQSSAWGLPYGDLLSPSRFGCTFLLHLPSAYPIISGTVPRSREGIPDPSTRQGPMADRLDFGVAARRPRGGSSDCLS